jgi:hypothetical protein
MLDTLRIPQKFVATLLPPLVLRAVRAGRLSTLATWTR